MEKNLEREITKLEELSNKLKTYELYEKYLLARLKLSESQVIKSILDEPERQDEKWGEQNHHPTVWLGIAMEEI